MTASQQLVPGVPLDPIQIYETVELRKIHEIKAAELACSRATEENYERLREILHEGSRKARGLAQETMERVRQAVKLKYT